MLLKTNRLIYFNDVLKQSKFLFLFLLISFQTYAQDLSINEVMSSNDTTIADEDGEFEDWIEIYNYGTTTINLNGYGLSDQTDNPFKWRFPSIELAAKEYIIVWASDKNRITDKDKLHTNFKIKSGGEAIVLTASTGTKLSESPAVALATDKSYGRIPNGTGNWTFIDTPTPKTNNSGASSSIPEKISINEFVSSNIAGLTDQDGDHSDWIEIYNYGTTSVNLAGFGLSDDRTLPYKWVFPSVTISPNQYIVIFASGKDRTNASSQLHTNFGIGAGGETLFLTNGNGLLISGGPSVNLQDDTSYGRQPDGTGSWLFFDTPTPGASNTSSGATTSLVAPDFSHSSGLYSSTINLELTTNIQNATIVYTLDGSEPDINKVGGSSFQYKNDFPHEVGMSFGALLNQNYTSYTYTTPIAISDRSSDADQLSIKTTTPDDPYIPPVRVRKFSVVRAKVYLNGKGSRTRTRNYFVWPNGNPYEVPVVALTTFEENLFGYNDGIYTPGAVFDQWRTENPDGNQPSRADFNNFGQSGRDWERNVNIQVFNKNLESILNQDAGLRIHGNTSRAHHLKNLRLYARSEYDEDNEFEFDVFSQQIPGSPNLYNNDFKRFLLRGNGSGGFIANDVVFNRLMQPFFNGIMRIETAVNFINGEYFGITAFRDRFDEHHLANNFGLDSGNLSIVGCVGGCADEEGNAYSELEDLFEYIKDNDLAVASNYQYVANRLDIDSFIDHLFIEIFSEGDSYETKYWKATNVVDDSFGDGKWRLYTQDFESAMKSSINWLDNFLEESNSKNRGLMVHLTQNEEFKTKLLNRFSDLMNTGFTEERFTNIVNYTFDEINPLLDEDRNRSPRNRFYSTGDQGRLLDWILERPADFRDQLKTAFSINGTADVKLFVSNPNAGYITLNTVDIKSSTPGVADQPYPWTGTYFEGIPVTVKAIPRPGYTFSHWSRDSNSTNSEITITPSGDLALQANFTPDEDFSHLLYFWLFDDAIENDLPIETLNSTYSRNSASAQLNYNSALSGYPFAENDANWRKASLERINEPTEINYQDLANDNIAFAPQMMKGLQVKQPFRSGGLENSLELAFSTVGYEDIKISLAITSDGAANAIIAQYWNGSSWISSNVPNNSQTISATFGRVEFDFSNVAMADENEDFKVRFSFNGANMTVEDGKKVVINNVAVSAIDKNVLSADRFVVEENSLSIYPNPAKNRVYISSNTAINKVVIHNIFGQTMHKSSEDKNNTTIDISNFSNGIYLVTVFGDGFSKTKKIVKR